MIRKRNEIIWESYSDDPASEDEKPFSIFKKLPVIALIACGAVLGNSLAANINISNNQQTEFGQGVLDLVTCDPDGVTLRPLTEMNGDSSGTKLMVSGIRISDISSTCNGKTFKIKFYEGTQQKPSTISKHFNSVEFVYKMNNSLMSSAFNFKEGDSWVEISFVYPFHSAGSALNITIESYSLGDSVMGIPDQTFGLGVVAIETPGRIESVIDIATDSTGNIYALTRSRLGTDVQLVVSKYSKKGSIDESYATNGSYRKTIAGQTSFSEIVLDRNGALYIFGYQEERGKIWGINNDGTTNIQFANNGTFTFDISGSDRTYINAGTINKNERLIATGHSCDDSVNRCKPFIIQVSNQGKLDGEFANGGILDIPTSVDSFLNAVAVDAAGSIYACGDTMEGSDGKVIGYKLGVNGVLDSSFGSNGKVIFNFTNTMESCLDIELNPKGGIYFAGYLTTSGIDQAHLMSLDDNGVLRSDFGLSGRLLLSPGSGIEVWATSLILSKNGEIYINAKDFSSVNRSGYLYRVLPDGVLDETFADSGLYNPIFVGGGWDWLNGVSIQQDNKVILFGYFGSSSSDSKGFLQQIR